MTPGADRQSLIDPDILLRAYGAGLFPMADPATGSISWHSPDPRAILELGDLKVARSLARVLKRKTYSVTVDAAFERVVRSCRRPQTWISETIVQSYLRLHERAVAHSLECWSGDRLAGGLYGVCLGAAFFGESMFSAVPDASKVAICGLSHALLERNYHFIDCQMMSAHLASLGARSLPRREFLQRLAAATQGPLAPDPGWRDTSFALPQAFMQNSRGSRGR